FFFFSSRRRHTRLQGDWSSDVCLPISICLQRAWRRQCRNRRVAAEWHLFGTNRLLVHSIRRQRFVLLRRWQRKLVASRRGIRAEIGRASCRERVWVQGGAGGLNKKEHG